MAKLSTWGLWPLPYSLQTRGSTDGHNDQYNFFFFKCYTVIAQGIIG